jgi:prepilin-type N-terminal cleavage/methylation domain-containing protein
MRRSRGFTLMEMMIALLIGAIVITPLYIITRGMAEETTKQQMETEAIQRSRIGLEMLAADLQRAGMMVSPDPANDPDSIVQDGQHAFHRKAIVHLNRGGGSSYDSLLLSGNFVSASTYTGFIDVAQIVISEPFPHIDDCLEEFNPDYSYVHLTAGTGQTLDAKIDSSTGVTCPPTGEGTQCQCTVNLASAELILDGPGGFALGQQVHLEANQTALYRVEEVFETDSSAACQRSHNNLLRYFVNYDGISSLGGDCDLSTITDNLINFASAKIIAEYVQEFEVWFRTPVAGATVDMVPNYHTPTEIAGADEGLSPCREVVIYEDTPGCNNPTADDLSCEPSAAEYSPQFVRSAVVRLAVRSEKTDMSMKFEDVDVDAGIVRYNVAPPQDPSTYCPDVGVFKVRTLVTEVALPNIAARMASFPELP